MRTLLVLLVSLSLASSSASDDNEAADATKLGERSSEVRLASVETMESAPPQLKVTIDVAMPEPMWKLAVDSISEPDATGRVVVKLTGTRPEGALPQVITMTPVRVSLGTLPSGSYLIDVFVERPPHSHRRAGTIMLDATR